MSWIHELWKKLPAPVILLTNLECQDLVKDKDIAWGWGKVELDRCEAAVSLNLVGEVRVAAVQGLRVCVGGGCS